MADIPILGRREPVRTCRCCGCDDNNACVDEFGPCAWVLLDVATATGICSRCAVDMEWHPALLASVGIDTDDVVAEKFAQARELGLIP
jgi:hypothetical protein